MTRLHRFFTWRTNWVAFLICLLPCLSGAEVRVWTVAQTRHVLRSEAPGNSTSVDLGAARNDWVSFQVLLRSDSATKISGLEAGELNGPGRAVLSRANAVLYRQHQLRLEIGTYRNEGFRPDCYPDPLIP